MLCVCKLLCSVVIIDVLTDMAFLGKYNRCYDVGVAVYMIVFLLWIVWLPLGISTLVSVDEQDKDDDADCQQVANFTRNSIICGFVYGFVVAMSFGCSLICLRL